MKKTTLALLLIVSLFACQTEPGKEPVQGNNNGTVDEADEVAVDIPLDSVVNKSFTAEKGERFLRLEVIIPASIDEVWKTFATEEGVKSWMAPVSKLDFRIGGEMRNHMNRRKKVGDEGTLILGIVNFVPNEMVTYKVNLGKFWGEKCEKEDGNLQEIVQLRPIGKDKVKVVSTMTGWGTGPEWDKVYNFFVYGNKITYDWMLERFKTRKPLDWAKYCP